jgi:hypothetical protein
MDLDSGETEGKISVWVGNDDGWQILLEMFEWVARKIIAL